MRRATPGTGTGAARSTGRSERVPRTPEPNVTFKRTGAAHICPCCQADTRLAACAHVPRYRAVVATMAEARQHTPPAGQVVVARGDATATGGPGGPGGQGGGWRIYYVPAYRLRDDD